MHSPWPIHLDWNMGDLYDAVMFDIEPDLLLDHLPALQRELALLPEHERRKRVQHYSAAMKEFCTRFERALQVFHTHATTIVRDCRATIKRLEKEHDLGRVQTLLEEIADVTPQGAP
ncbi:MAG: hypothetical protein V1926_05070 [Candidatus Peregrinibacteria bacterium]